MPAKSHTLDMTEGPLLRKVLVYTLPLIFSGALQLCFTQADMIVIGRFASSTALAAIGATSHICILMITLAFGISIGTNVIVATRFGAKDKRGMSRAIHTSLAVGIGSGIFFMLLWLLISHPILELTKVPSEIIDLSCLYLRIFCLGMPFALLYNIGSAILRAIGDTKRPLYYLTTAGIVNIVLNLILVVGFDFSVAGVAIATVTSHIISTTLVLRGIAKTHEIGRIRAKLLHIDRNTLVPLLKYGIPASFQSSMFAIANILIQSNINSFGKHLMAGNAASMGYEGLVDVLCTAIYQATATIVGQNRGAKKLDRVKLSICHCFLVAISIGLMISAINFYLAPNLISIYNTDPQVIAYGSQRLRIMGTTGVICALMDVAAGGLLGMGRPILPTVVTMLGVCLFRTLWVIFIFPLNHVPWFLYICYPISWTLVFFVNGGFLFKTLKNSTKR